MDHVAEKLFFIKKFTDKKYNVIQLSKLHDIKLVELEIIDQL